MDDLEGLARAYNLTAREQQVMKLASLGLANKQIASQLGLTEGTVRVHLSNVCQKLGVKNRTAMVAALARARGGVAPKTGGKG
jgi:DNA-binding NarL/FixJ family response regulator